VAQPFGRPDDVLVGPRSSKPDRRVNLYLLLATTFVAVVVYVSALLLDVLPPRGLTVASNIWAKNPTRQRKGLHMQPLARILFYY
jgi:hypothetical protein